MKKIIYFLLAAFNLSTPIDALITIVPNGSTKTETLILVNERDSAIIEEKGAIVPTLLSDEGVTINASN